MDMTNMAMKLEKLCTSIEKHACRCENLPDDPRSIEIACKIVKAAEKLAPDVHTYAEETINVLVKANPEAARRIVFDWNFKMRDEWIRLNALLVETDTKPLGYNSRAIWMLHDALDKIFNELEIND